MPPALRDDPGEQNVMRLAGDRVQELDLESDSHGAAAKAGMPQDPVIVPLSTSETASQVTPKGQARHQDGSEIFHPHLALG